MTRYRQQESDYRIELNEHNLFYHVNTGPTQLRRVLDSPMLESAQERQFAISQLGLRNGGFEIEHAVRMDNALQVCLHRFNSHQTNESFRPTSPYYEDLADFRSALSYTDPIPSQPISDLLEGIPSSPTPTVKSVRSVKSPMSVESLMNPEIIPPPERKRKYSDCLSSGIAADDSPEEPEILNTPELLQKTFKYTRTTAVIPGQGVRLRRDTRMRRSNFDRGQSKPKDMYADRARDY